MLKLELEVIGDFSKELKDLINDPLNEKKPLDKLAQALENRDLKVSEVGLTNEYDESLLGFGIKSVTKNLHIKIIG